MAGFWSAQEQPYRRMSVARAPGGQGIVQPRYNPNSAMETFKRGASTGVASGDPRRPLSLAGLSESANEADRAELANVAAVTEAEGQSANPIFGRNIDTINKTHMARMGQSQQRSSPWRLFFQALQNQGVGELQTGAAAPVSQGGGAELGFLDTQAPSMAGLHPGAAIANRQNQVRNFMANYNAGASQDRRRY